MEQGRTKLLKSYKTEIDPTPEQKRIINKTIGVCRFVYNFYLAHNKEIYEKENRFVSGYEFSRWLNNIYLPENQDKMWIKDVSSKSVKQSIMNAEYAYRRFFKGKSRFPNLKKKGKSDVKMYFVKKDSKTIITCERHRIKIPTLGWVRIKEKGYIPTNSKTHIIKSGTISTHAGRYYVSVLVEEQGNPKPQLNDFGLGVDLGVKVLGYVSSGLVFENINYTTIIRKLEKQLKREQRCLSRKYEDYKKRCKNNKKEEVTRQNYEKQKLKVQKLHQRLANIRTDYINKCVNELVKTKPAYITIEDLNIRGLMKDKHNSKAIQGQKWYEFRAKLTTKCHELGIELRVVDRFFPSSKLCHECGYKHKDLKRSDRVFICPKCGYIEDRDYNAALNLRDTKTYKIA